jgi:hypothetical protein
MTVLKVISSLDEPVFSAFHEAINAVRKSPRHLAARNTSKELSGAIVLDFAFGASWLDLYLSEDRSLVVYLEGGIVCWRVQKWVEAKRHTEEQPTLELAFAHKAEPYVWDRAALLSGFVNRHIQMLSASIALCFLTVQGNPTIMFSRLEIAQNSSNLLFYDPE